MVSCIAARSSSLKTLPDVFAKLVRFVDAFGSAIVFVPHSTRRRSGVIVPTVSVD